MIKFPAYLAVGGGLFFLYGSVFGQHLAGRLVGGQLEVKVCVLVPFLKSAGLDCPSDSDGTTMEAPQHQRDEKGTGEKAIWTYQVHLQVFALQKRNPYHIYWLRFHFPSGVGRRGGGDGGLCNEKRNEAGLFLTERFVDTVDFTRRADISGSWTRRRRRRKKKWGDGVEKMSLINQKQNDQRPVSAHKNNTPTPYCSSRKWRRERRRPGAAASAARPACLSSTAATNGACSGNYTHPQPPADRRAYLESL